MQKTSKHCNFCVLGGDTTGKCRFLTVFLIGDMANEFPIVMDSLLKGTTFTIYYIDDIIMASKATVEEQKAIVKRILQILDENNIAVKWGKLCIFPEGDIMARIQDLKAEVRPLIGEADAIKKHPGPKKYLNFVHSSVRSMNTLSSSRTYHS